MAVFAWNLSFFGEPMMVRAQDPLQMITESAHRHTDFHAGIHSGTWTLKREQILEEESKCKHRSCRAPYCSRCSKHLADYGHEYQFIDGPSQRQLWYRATAGSIAPVTQRGYDEHGIPYHRRGRPGVVMAWEYQQVLNHAICEQIRARNAVAAEEAAEDRVGILSDLRDIALLRFQQSDAEWQSFEGGACFHVHGRPGPCAATQNGVGFEVSGEKSNLCDYCQARAYYLRDKAYLEKVEKELSLAVAEWKRKTAIADEAVRIALISKPDADRATRFKRIQHKPPRYQEVLAAQKFAEEKMENEKKSE